VWIREEKGGDRGKERKRMICIIDVDNDVAVDATVDVNE
jgi:hypothetical protein